MALTCLTGILYYQKHQGEIYVEKHDGCQHWTVTESHLSSTYEHFVNKHHWPWSLDDTLCLVLWTIRLIDNVNTGWVQMVILWSVLPLVNLFDHAQRPAKLSPLWLGSNCLNSNWNILPSGGSCQKCHSWTHSCTQGAPLWLGSYVKY